MGAGLTDHYEKSCAGEQRAERDAAGPVLDVVNTSRGASQYKQFEVVQCKRHSLKETGRCPREALQDDIPRGILINNLALIVKMTRILT